MDISIPNTDFKNERGLVSLSFRKVDGGYYLTENFSKSEYAITNTGGIHGLINQIGAEMLRELDARFSKAKKNDVITIEFQIREGTFPLLFGTGIIGLSGGLSESTLFSQLMSSIVYVLNINPNIFGGKKYKTTREGFVLFVEDLRKGAGIPFMRPLAPTDPLVNPFVSGGMMPPMQAADFIEIVEANGLSPNSTETVDSKGRIKV